MGARLCPAALRAGKGPDADASCSVRGQGPPPPPSSPRRECARPALCESTTAPHRCIAQPLESSLNHCLLTGYVLGAGSACHQLRARERLLGAAIFQTLRL
mmetsp:Transcript_4631/g.19737  ORF Transcript_4631/g.19737 Transcript_4631/m.19737 type:complete len:101 (-) Transcript_4631:152-454(-)